jgi:hypothetical protein
MHGAHQLPGILNLPATIQTDLVRLPFDGKHPAQLAVMTSEGELEHPARESHKILRTSALIAASLAPSHSGRERILARATAIEQSAALR